MGTIGKSLKPEELRRRIGHMDQVAGIRLVQFDDGRARPARAALVHTGSGLEFTVALDRGMDIAAASYNGQAMGWRATVGDVAPQYYEAEGIRWLRSYFGGLLTTCGLSNVGGPAEDSAVSGVGLHGRIGNIPAENLQVRQEWEGDAYVLSITGTLRETVLFGEKLALTRTIRTQLGATTFTVHDEVVNEGFKTVPLMLLYHCNIGWPVVDAGSEVILPSKQLAPLVETARRGAEQWNRCDPPTHGCAEKVYYHDLTPERDGSVTAAIVNRQGFGAYVRFNKRQLPRFVQWKMMGEQDYVVGLEPCNCGVGGRKADEEAGLLHTIAPGEKRAFSLEFGAVTSKQEAQALRALRPKAPAKIVDSYLRFTKPVQ